VAGENYLRQAERATRVQQTIEADSATLDCGGAAVVTLGENKSHGLPRDYTIPPGTSQSAVIAITFALAQLGKPYLWGATGPASFDCSGLTQAAWQRAGAPIGRTTWDQLDDGATTTLDTLSPGDLILTPGGNGTLASPGHVGMYLGHGLVIHAPRTGDVVKVAAVGPFTARGTSGLRHIG
jgi:cell wall-associated NlpC family hydrolase